MTGPAPSGERTVIDTAAVPTEKGATQEPQATPEGFNKFLMD